MSNELEMIQSYIFLVWIFKKHLVLEYFNLASHFYFFHLTVHTLTHVLAINSQLLSF